MLPLVVLPCEGLLFEPPPRIRVLILVLASTQISQPLWRWRGQRREGGELAVVGSVPAMNMSRVRGLGWGGGYMVYWICCVG